MWYKKIKQDLKELKKNSRLRVLQLPEGMDFTSNDYLSLSHCGEIKREIIKKIKTLPVNSGGSRLLRGHHPVFDTLEAVFRDFQERPAALFFSSGYMANLGLSPLFQDAAVFSDEYNHNSLINSIKMSKKKVCHIYPHKDLKKLEKLLKSTKGRKVMVTESLFSMEGDFADLNTLSKLALRYEALLIVDEAHSTGIFGKNGEGLCKSVLGNRDHIISVHPCGKALACSGALVAGPKHLKDWLINTSHPFIFSTAPNPVTAVQILAAIKFLKRNPNRRKRLFNNIACFKSCLNAHLRPKQDSPIFSIFIRGNKQVLQAADTLKRKGFDIRAIRYPTVAKSRERLRISIHSHHKKEDLKCLAKILNAFSF